MKNILFFILPIYALFSCGKKSEKTATPVKKDTVFAVYASGNLVPEWEYHILPMTDGYISEINISEGDTVSKNQWLYKLSNSNAQTAMQNALNVFQKSADLYGKNAPQVNELIQRYGLANAKCKLDSANEKRYASLKNAGAVSLATYEKYALQWESSKRELKQIAEQLSQARKNSDLQLQQSANAKLSAENTLSNSLVLCLKNGVVYQVDKKEGDYVNPSQPLGIIGSSQLLARLQIDEDDFEKVYPQQEVLISMDAFPGKIFKARIAKIYPMLNKVDQSFKADAIFIDPLPKAIYGLNLEANILLNPSRNEQ